MYSMGQVGLHLPKKYPDPFYINLGDLLHYDISVVSMYKD